jgi:hypothetical protein
MERGLTEVFEQARAIVEEADRRVAEEQQRILDAERDKIVDALAANLDEAFDFSSHEKLELDPRLDVLEGRGVVEFVVRSSRSMFLLAQAEGGKWHLSVAEDGQQWQSLGEFDSGNKGDSASRRLAAARVVTAIGNSVGRKAPRGRSSSAKPAKASSTVSELPVLDEHENKPKAVVPEFGKSFGY